MRRHRLKWPPPLAFTTRSRLTAIGSRWKATGSAGNRPLRLSIQAGVLIATEVAGFGAIRVGIGIPIIAGVGRRSIMGAGRVIRAWAGCGCLAPFGVLP